MRFDIISQVLFLCVDSDGYTAFCDDWYRPVVREHNPKDYPVTVCQRMDTCRKGPRANVPCDGTGF